MKILEHIATEGDYFSFNITQADVEREFERRLSLNEDRPKRGDSFDLGDR